MSSVDLSKARAGDTVKFRCGGTAVIKKVEGTPIEKWLDVHLVGYGSELTYKRDGGLAGPKGSTPLDIIQVIPIPVIPTNGQINAALKHIAEWRPNAESKPHVELIVKVLGWAMYNRNKIDLTRSPEHDVEAV